MVGPEDLGAPDRVAGVAGLRREQPGQDRGQALAAPLGRGHHRELRERLRCHRVHRVSDERPARGGGGVTDATTGLGPSKQPGLPFGQVWHASVEAGPPTLRTEILDQLVQGFPIRLGDGDQVQATLG